jgi:hypothetical protein
MRHGSRDDILALAISGNATPKARLPSAKASPWCWHCCHPIPDVAVPLPVAYDTRRDTWTVRGAFCSWGCAKAWNWDAGAGYRSALRGQLLTLLRKRTTGTLTGTVPAPPRETLAVFGGTLSIEEFRSKSDSRLIVDVLPHKLVPLEYIVHQRKVEAKRAADAPKPDMAESVDFAGAVQKNETLRLKRPKPMPSSSDVLARTMGLQIT